MIKQSSRIFCYCWCIKKQLFSYCTSKQYFALSKNLVSFFNKTKSKIYKSVWNYYGFFDNIKKYYLSLLQYYSFDRQWKEYFGFLVTNNGTHWYLIDPNYSNHITRSYYISYGSIIVLCAFSKNKHPKADRNY